MQQDLRENYPDLDIEIIGLNEIGHEGGNELAAGEGDIPWLQDVDSDGNGVSDVWRESWDVTYRDVIILDASNVKVGTYNLTTFDLAEGENYDTLLQMMVNAAVEQPAWQNPNDALDVNGDTFLTPVGDVLPLVNELNLREVSGEFGALPALTSGAGSPPPFLDVNGDNFITPAGDVLPIINALNEAPVGEGESVADPAPSVTLFAVPSETHYEVSQGWSSESEESQEDPNPPTRLPSESARSPASVRRSETDEETPDSSAHLDLDSFLLDLAHVWYG